MDPNDYCAQHRHQHPCSYCIENLIEDVEEAHNLLDTANIPRRRRGKIDLTLGGRLRMLFERDARSLSEMRTS